MRIRSYREGTKLCAWTLVGVVLMALALVIFSCGSHKSNFKQKTSIDACSSYQRKDTASASLQVTKTEAENVTEEAEEVTIIYDTSKPTDPNTGKPPVLSETKNTIKKGIAKKKDESSATTSNQSSVEQSRDSTKVSDRREEDKQKTETAVPRQINLAVWGLVALVLFCGVGWLAYRWRKK